MKEDPDYRQGKEMTMEDLIQEEDMVVTITHNGFIKRTPVSAYKAASAAAAA